MNYFLFAYLINNCPFHFLKLKSSRTQNSLVHELLERLLFETQNNTNDGVMMVIPKASGCLDGVHAQLIMMFIICTRVQSCSGPAAFWDRLKRARMPTQNQKKRHT